MGRGLDHWIAGEVVQSWWRHRLASRRAGEALPGWQAEQAGLAGHDGPGAELVDQRDSWRRLPGLGDAEAGQVPDGVGDREDLLGRQHGLLDRIAVQGQSADPWPEPTRAELVPEHHLAGDLEALSRGRVAQLVAERRHLRRRLRTRRGGHARGDTGHRHYDHPSCGEHPRRGSLRFSYTSQPSLRAAPTKRPEFPAKRLARRRVGMLCQHPSGIPDSSGAVRLGIC